MVIKNTDTHTTTKANGTKLNIFWMHEHFLGTFWGFFCKWSEKLQSNMQWKRNRRWRYLK